MPRTTAKAEQPLQTNPEIANKLLALAQLLKAKGENPFKIRAYRRAAETIRDLPESVAAMVRSGADLTAVPGVGKGIAGAVSELVQTGGLKNMETLKTEVSPEVAALTEYPRLDPKRVQQVFKKLGIASVEELKSSLARGDIRAKLGLRTEQHVRQAMQEEEQILLYDADVLVPAIERYLTEKCGAGRVEAAGDFRRRVEVLSELVFLVEASDFPAVADKFVTFGGGIQAIETGKSGATFKMASGVLVRLERAEKTKWGLALLLATGSGAHLEALGKAGKDPARLIELREGLQTEAAVYRKLGLSWVEPELREGHGEVDLAIGGNLPRLVTREDLRGDLHAHSTSSDGAQTIEAMAAAAKELGYSYLGITDHSQSLKIAGGVSEEDLWKQIKAIDRLNEKLRGIQILKSAEVDILADGTLDYSDALLAELDYAIGSIHSKFALDRRQQTERFLRAMENPYLDIIGHATGRLLLKRTGYEVEMERLIEQARQAGCFFEINSSPDRLDLSSDHARLAKEAGLKIAVNTDAHSVSELEFIRCGLDVARRAGLEGKDILNTYTWAQLRKLLRRRR